LFSLLSHPPPRLEMYNIQPLPTKKVIVLDPWVEPFPAPGPKPWRVGSNMEATHTPELLILNSEGFTLWDVHFQQLQEIVKIWDSFGAKLYTLIGSRHISFSDINLLVRTGQKRKDAKHLLKVIAELSSGWMDDHFKDVLSRHTVVKDPQIEKFHAKGKTEWSRRFVGNVGDIIVHD